MPQCSPGKWKSQTLPSHSFQIKVKWIQLHNPPVGEAAQVWEGTWGPHLPSWTMTRPEALGLCLGQVPRTQPGQGFQAPTWLPKQWLPKFKGWRGCPTHAPWNIATAFNGCYIKDQMCGSRYGLETIYHRLGLDPHAGTQTQPKPTVPGFRT